jgi:excisionase family DNA binding protein
MLSVDELAARWGVDRKTIYLQIQRCQLPAVRIGRAIRIPLGIVESVEQGGAVREGQ